MGNSKLFRMPEKARNKPEISDVKEIKRIAVVGAGRDVGVSLLTGLLVSYVSGMPALEGNVSLIEMGTPYFYEAYGVEKRFLHRDFLSFYDILDQKGSIKKLSNIEENINWILRCPPKEPGRSVIFSAEPQSNTNLSRSLRLVHNVQGDLLFFDCSGMSEEILWDILPEMDAVVLVIDPMPSRLVPAAAIIERLRLTVNGIVPLVNKMNKGVHKGELCRFLGINDSLTLPFLNPENLYKAEYNCVLPYALAAIKKETETQLHSLWELICQGV